MASEAMTEREPMSNEERLRKALEEIKFLHDHHVIHLDGCSFANNMGHIALNVLASTEPEQPGPNDCRDCGAPHWYNFMVPDDVWKKIAPDQPCLPEEGGMLCAQCIDKRCAALGIEAEGKFYFKGEAVVSRYPEEPQEQGEPKHGFRIVGDEDALLETCEGEPVEMESVGIYEDMPTACPRCGDRFVLKMGHSILYALPEPAGGEDGKE